MIGMFVISVVIAFDSWVQAWVFSVLQEGKSNSIAPFFNFVKVWNHGISFGMLNNMPYSQWILSLFAIAVSVFLSRLLLRSENSSEALGYSLIIGGAVGNAIDRVLYGAVADYLDFHAFGYHWPAFNVTDSAIFMGVTLILLFFGKTAKSTT